MIKVYASKFDTSPTEVHEICAAMTVEQWLRSKASSFKAQNVPPVSVSVNGFVVDPGLWAEFEMQPADEVSVCAEPKNDTFNLIFNPIAHSKIGLLKYMMPKISANNGRNNNGKDISEATVRNNQAKVNSTIREIAGTYKVYPDLLLPMHRYFVDRKNVWSEVFLCVGKGEYDIPAASVLVGDTRISALGSDAEYQIFAPGADVSSVSMSDWWHSVSEVGVTSAGKAGLELNAEFAGDPVATASSYQFEGNTISIPTGAGFFPAGWAAGMTLVVYEMQTYNVIEGWTAPDIIQGDMSTLQPFVGMKIDIVGENSGSYTIETYNSGTGQITLTFDDGSQVNGLLVGSRRMSLAYRGSKYEIASVTTDGSGNITAIQVSRLTDEGETDLTWGGFTFAIINDAVIRLDGSGVEGGWAGPFAACPEGEVTNTVEYDIMFPQGLCIVNSEGKINEITVNVELQWQDMSSPGWHSVLKSYTGKTVDQAGYTEVLSLPGSIRPEVRMRRIGAKSTNVGAKDTVQWYALKSKLDAPTAYDGVTTMAVKIRGGDHISNQSDNQISVKATRKLPIRISGLWTAPVATRSSMAWAAYVLKSIGYTDADIDLAAMDELDALLAARGDYYDFAIESQGTVKSELASAFRAGFAELTIDRGTVKPVREQPRTVYEHMYSPQNMTEPLQRSFTMMRPDDFDGVDVEYVDGTTWAKETVECRLPGDQGNKVEKISINGVTDKIRAWRIGMRQRRMHRYRRWSYSFSTELDALNSKYLSFCALGDDVPGYSQSAILEECAVGNTVMLRSSEPLVWVDGQDHVVAIRRQDGTLSGPYPAIKISDTLLEIPSIDFVLDTSWDVEPPHLLFGTSTKWSYPVLVTSIDHSSNNKVSVEAVNYDERIYADDDNAPS